MWARREVIIRVKRSSNTTTAPVTVIYSYTVTANGCAKIAQLVAVDVNPIPYLSSSLSPGSVCSGATFNYVPASPNANGFTWTQGRSNGRMSNTAGTSSGNPEVHEVLQNTTLVPRLVTYSYTLTNNTLTCSSNTQLVQVAVMPTPTVANQVLTAVCNTNSFLSSPTGVPEGTLYTWSTPQPINSSAVITGGSAVSVGQLVYQPGAYQCGGINRDHALYGYVRVPRPVSAVLFLLMCP
jgi:hypothetical protein